MCLRSTIFGVALLLAAGGFASAPLATSFPTGERPLINTGFQDTAPQVLGDFPLCEASSAVLLGGDRLLVGDNEVTKTLFTFPLNNGQLEPEHETKLPLRIVGEISDIEALVGLESGEFVVFGSHSRNKRCKSRKERRRFLRGSVTADGFVASSDGVVEMSKKVSCERLFGDIPDGTPLLAAVCERIDAVKVVADEIEDSSASRARREAACNEAQPFNAEGANVVFSPCLQQ